MPPKKKVNPEAVEQKEFRVFDPANVKKSVEVAAKPKPSVEDLQTVEKVGDAEKIEKELKKRSSTGKKKVSKRKKKPATKKAVKKPAVFKEKALKKDGYVFVVTEKPQAADKIAAALSEGKARKVANRAKVSYYEFERGGKRVVVGCAVGHLFTISQNVKGADYPIFDIGWYPNSAVKRGVDFTRKYFDVIKKLVTGASEIVIATDFDVEGEVIGYTVMKYIANQKDASRMKFSSLTAGELQDSFDNRANHIEWGQAIAGETRHFLDWLYGINLSRALMNSIKTTGKFAVMSIGRVQGPALHMIVEKEKQIQAFKPTPYWQIFLEVNDGKNKLEVKHNRDITKKEELGKFEKLKGGKGVAKTTKKSQVITPPAPFDLTSLQTEAYKFHGITPVNALSVAQKLYLAGLISYPRTSSQKIGDLKSAEKVLKLLEKNHSSLVKEVSRKVPVEGNKSDPAHPAIIPTGTHSNRLSDYDEKIYNLIVKRFISCYCADAELENKRVNVDVSSGLKFAARGMEVKKSGWMKVYPTKMEAKELKDMDGEVNIDEVKIEEKETKPPNRFSPASIVTALEKKNLGTKATRANIIETLYDRNYVKGKSITATELGIRLIDSLKKYSPVIIEEELTREIEKDMDNIRSSKHDLDVKKGKVIGKAEDALTKISKDFKKNEVVIGKELRGANEAAWAQEKEDNKLLKCTGCGKGFLSLRYTPRFKSYFVGCETYPDCTQTYPLPSGCVVKKVEGKMCEECGWPMLIRYKPSKRPWVFCFNPKCPTRLELDLSGKAKKKGARYVGGKTKTAESKGVADIGVKEKGEDVGVEKGDGVGVGRGGDVEVKKVKEK
ncbi:DNA topoisomerase I [archaeon]|jgi:DNA topoisomerase I|nr:DNA topoisomerase I [archaeon]